MVPPTIIRRRAASEKRAKGRRAAVAGTVAEGGEAVGSDSGRAGGSSSMVRMLTVEAFLVYCRHMHTASFIVLLLPYATKYTLGLREELRDQRGGVLPKGASFSFTTIGHVAVTSATPYKGSTGVKVGTPLRITFDQPVDHNSAEARFVLSPAATGTFSWQGQTMTYQAVLSKDTTYQFGVSAGVESLIGLPLEGGVSNTFQTEETVTLLAIPVYYQRYVLSCEVASLKMALGYKGVAVSEEELLANLPTESAARNGDAWADPDQVFVGDVNGRQNTTGYGVHAAPILTLAKQYGSAQGTSGWSKSQVAASLAAGNPVVMWGTAGSAKRDSWMTPSGRRAETWVGEHVRTIVGFTGRAESPTGFIINDPIYGRLRWSAAQFEANWATLGNMGVAIL
jgi:uncharacterized protein YvpB